MTTVVNNPTPRSEDGSAAGVVVGILLAVLIILAIWFLVVPAINQRNETPPQNGTIDVNVTLPEGSTNNSTNSGGNSGAGTPSPNY